MSAGESALECRTCGEINKEGSVACARCGTSLLSASQVKEYRARIELGKRQAERESVEYTTTANLLLNRFSSPTQNRGRYFSSLSNHRKRIGLVCAAAAILLVVVLGIATGH